MTVYLDTSALVKRYVREPGTARVQALWRQADHRATSRGDIPCEAQTAYTWHRAWNSVGGSTNR